MKAQYPMDILFMDPPYGKGLWERALFEFLKQNWIDKNTLIIIEEDKANKIEIPKTQEQIENEELKDKIKELEKKLKERNKNNEF